MLQFVLGRAASGKSWEIINRIKASVARGESPVLIVPEQFSFESEKSVLGAIGDYAAQSVSVLSFTRLCDEIERLSGGFGGRVLTDADRNILMRRAVRRAGEDLGPFKRYADSVGFVQSVSDIISEFKLNAISPEQLLGVSENAAGVIAEKLRAIAAVYLSFEQLTAERFCDPADRLSRIYYRLENCRYFENRPVFIDSFKGFTGAQLKILDRIFAQSGEVTVALCLDKSVGVGVFDNIASLKSRITRAATAHGVGVAEDFVLDKGFYESRGLAALEGLLATGETAEKSGEGITVCYAKTVYDEAEFAARTIRKIIRTTGARMDDFIIIARDTAAYENALDAACQKNGINCFIDRRLPFLSMPPAVCVLSGLQAAIRFTTENILSFHKSGLEILSVDELSTLENYTYLWNIKGDDFLSDWDMNPAGFTDRELDKAQLDRINSLRKRAIEPLLGFKSDFFGTSENRARAVYELLQGCGHEKAFKNLEQHYRNTGNPQFADALRGSYKELITLLESLAACFGDEEITSKEFYEAFKNAAALITVGVIPQTLDEVTFGAADRIRPSRPKYAFILGAAQGVFPALLPKGGIFGAADRTELIALGLEISDYTDIAATDEEFLLYSSLCCASNGVYITVPADYNGTAVSPSIFVNDIVNTLSVNTVCEPDGLAAENLPETAEAAFSRLCATSSESEAEQITAALCGTPQSERYENIVRANNPDRFKITPQSAASLFGRNIRMSPSKFDDFSRCRFMFFCRDGLGVRALQPAQFDVMQRGTLVHYVLQRVIEAYGKGIGEVKDEEIPLIVERFTDEYLDSIVGYRGREDGYMRFLVGAMKRSLVFVVKRLSLEFAQSDFEPVRCELKIGSDDGIPEIKIPLENAGLLTLIGTVDRLDRWNGYVRIIDYKTGSRSFRLPDILFGQNMQMLIYLYAVSRDKNLGGNPAGILYMPSSHKIGDTAAGRRMNGVILDEPEVLAAMEKDNKGKFVPRLSSTSSDSFVSKTDFEDIFKFIEGSLANAGNRILSGDVAPSPVDGLDSAACKYCDFSAICNMRDQKHPTVEHSDNAEVMQKVREANESGF